MSKKFVYLFTEGNGTMRELLGGKGANLAEMTNIGLPVPQGFTITTEACTQYYEDGKKINDDIQKEILENVTKLEGLVCFGGGDPFACGCAPGLHTTLYRKDFPSGAV